APAAATTAEVPEVSFLHRPCFVDSKLTSGDFCSIELRDCFLRSGFVRHLHKGETVRTPGIAICDDLSRCNLTDRAEHIAKVRFCGSGRKVCNEFFCHYSSICCRFMNPTRQLCPVDFRFDRMTPKGDLPRKQWPPIPVAIKTCKGYTKKIDSR